MGLVLGLLVLSLWPLSGGAVTADEVVGEATAPVADVVSGVTSEAERLRQEAAEQARQQAAAPVTREEQGPITNPPLHGTEPHGQGTVAVVDVGPAAGRPQGGEPDGSDSGEEIVVGRARGEQEANGDYHGHVTILALFGTEILGVDTAPGQTESGPLNAVQEGVLTPLCDASGEQICLSAVTADSSTTEDGSANRFSAARVTIGGAEGIDAGVAESRGDISDDGTCQTARGQSTVADVNLGGQAAADVAQSSTESRACRGQAPTQTNSSSVIGLGGTGVPFPDPGCAEGTPDTVTGIPTIAPVVCNADDTNGAQAAAPYGVRDALDVFLLAVNGSQLTKLSTAASESRAQAPPAQCADGEDNDGDGRVDADDPGCLGPDGTYDPNDDSEADGGPAECADGADNDGDGVADAADPGCHTDGNAGNPESYDPTDDDESDDRRRDGEDDDGGAAGGGGGGDAPECSDGTDNDGDRHIDRDDPGCLSGPGGTYDPQDDSEADARRELGSLAMTGSDALLVAIAGLLTLASGLELRRRSRRLGGLG